MTARDCKFLIVEDDVKLTPTIERGIISLDKEFEKEGVIAHVTSGERTSQDQLDTIRRYCKRYKIDAEFKEILVCGVTDTIDFGGGKKLFTWQRPWSRLLNIGVIINPPLPAACLFDYIRDGVNKKGQIINHSPHFYGKAFDIGGGLDHDISNELAVVVGALKIGPIPFIKGYLPERKQNCLHIDCIPI